MSSDIYSKPDLFPKVKYTRKAEEEDWELTSMCLYKYDDTVGDHAVFQPQEEEQQIQDQPVVKKPCVRRETLCKGVLCIVVLVGLTVLCLYLNKKQLDSSCESLNQNSLLKDEFKQLIDKLEVELHKLNSSYSQKLQELLVNNMQLQISYETLSKSYSLLKDEVNLKDKVEGKWCPEGWTRFGCSCYFRSTETKSWFESRTYCQEKGAHLVIIDTEEEQNFVADLNRNGESWIGLKITGEWRDGQKTYEWKWLDGSPLTKTFWELGSPSASSSWLFATCCNKQGKWRHSYAEYKTWICEK